MSYPVGSQVICTFAFTTRELTRDEHRTFIDAQTLPDGVGVDPPVVNFDYRIDDFPVQTGASPIRDSQGVYHVALPLTTPGVLTWRGYGEDLFAQPIASTVAQEFVVTPSI